MGLNQGGGLSHENFLLEHNEQMGNVKDDSSFNIGSWKQLRVKDTNALRQKVKVQVEKYFGLN